MARTDRTPRSASSRGASTTPRRYTVKSRTAQSAADAQDTNKEHEESVPDFSKYRGWRMLLNPIWCYHGFFISVLMLTVFGLIMVFSSSSVSMVAAGAAPWTQAVSQGIFCAVGLTLFAITSLIPYRHYKNASIIIMVFAIGLQSLTLTPMGIEVGGNRGWIGSGSFTFQPAEFMKLALCIALPRMLMEVQQQTKGNTRQTLKDYRTPLAVFVVAAGLVIAGKDLGTCLILLAIGITAFWFGGLPSKYMKAFFALVIVGVALAALLSPNRMRRILATYQGCSTSDLQDTCYQSIHSQYAIASGGFFGVGLGNSREKWNYLPEAHNDFIYAIIGEETGFIGAIAVLLLFAVLAWCMIVIALRISNRYVSVALMCFAVWIVGQALINIAVVVGLLPVMGVPMPFISAGGSSLIMCLTAAGICMSMMRAQPQIKAERAKS